MLGRCRSIKEVDAQRPPTSKDCRKLEKGKNRNKLDTIAGPRADPLATIIIEAESKRQDTAQADNATYKKL